MWTIACAHRQLHSNWKCNIFNFAVFWASFRVFIFSLFYKDLPVMNDQPCMSFWRLYFYKIKIISIFMYYYKSFFFLTRWDKNIIFTVIIDLHVQCFYFYTDVKDRVSSGTCFVNVAILGLKEEIHMRINLVLTHHLYIDTYKLCFSCWNLGQPIIL